MMRLTPVILTALTLAKKSNDLAKICWESSKVADVKGCSSNYFHRAEVDYAVWYNNEVKCNKEPYAKLGLKHYAAPTGDHFGRQAEAAAASDLGR